MISTENQNKITNVENLLKNELSTITELKSSADNNKKYLMETLETLSNNFNSDNVVEEAHMLPQLFKSLNDSLAKVNSNLLILKDLESNINSVLFTISMQLSNNTIDIDDLNNKLNLYNLKKQETKNTLLNNSAYIERFIVSTKALVNTLVSNVENSKENIIKNFKENRNNNSSIVDTEATNNYASCENNELYKPYKIQENDTLLISEKQEKVFLPYTLNDLSAFTKDTEKSLEDVVRENFIIPLNTFKNPTISRFKAAYNLAKHKSNCSLLKSFNFAVEMMFKYNLNPAIIIACKNIDELKDYLHCLKEQKLDLFKHFKIKYEMNPMKI